MIVPKHWVEVKLEGKYQRRRIVVRRWGWSNDSEEDARRMAEERAETALQVRLAGGVEAHRDTNVPYASPDGFPIREEVLGEHEDCVITRNSYGARCLNVPDVLIADVDFPVPPRMNLGPWFLLAFGVVLQLLSVPLGYVPVVIAVIWAVAQWLRIRRSIRDPDGRARALLKRFLEEHPHWRVRLYRTPAGLRLIAEHARFEAQSPEVSAFFTALGTDPKYMRLCKLQDCFRARLTAKPWRIGIRDRLRPRPGVWPLDSDEKRALRQAWVKRYESAAQGFAACHFVESLGSSHRNPYVARVVKLHDKLSRARSELPVA